MIGDEELGDGAALAGLAVDISPGLDFNNTVFTATIKVSNQWCIGIT